MDLCYWSDEGFRDIVTNELVNDSIEGLSTPIGWCVSPPCTEENYELA